MNLQNFEVAHDKDSKYGRINLLIRQILAYSHNSSIEQRRDSNPDRPLVNGKNWAEQQLELRQRRSQIPKSMQYALHHGTFDPDRNYE